MPPPHDRRKRLSPRGVRVFFLCTGLFFGWRWAFGDHGPAWQHALQVLVTMLTAMTVAELLRWRRRRRAGVSRAGGFPVRQLILTKLLLVGLALAVEYLLHRWISPDQAQLAVGAALGASIAVIGPILHRRHNTEERAECAGTYGQANVVRYR